MNAEEKRLYAEELRLIKKHFPGLKPRPIKIDHSLGHYARADEPSMLFNLKLHRSKKEITETLIHELIHYELFDKTGKGCWHNRAFQRRAKDLGILGAIELEQCSSLEEQEYKPHSVELKKIPLKDYVLQIDRDFNKANDFVAKRCPVNVRGQIWSLVKGLEIHWRIYRQAKERGEDHVIEEIWQPRRGPVGKPLHLLLEEHKELETKFTELQKRLFEDSPTAKGKELEKNKIWKEMMRVRKKAERYRERIQRDYGRDPE